MKIFIKIKTVRVLDSIILLKSFYLALIMSFILFWWNSVFYFWSISVFYLPILLKHSGIKVLLFRVWLKQTSIHKNNLLLSKFQKTFQTNKYFICSSKYSTSEPILLTTNFIAATITTSLLVSSIYSSFASSSSVSSEVMHVEI